MLNDATCFKNVYIACGYTDLRSGIDRLSGNKFLWPRSQKEVMQLSAQQFRWLMEGLTISPKKSVKPVHPKRVV